MIHDEIDSAPWGGEILRFEWRRFHGALVVWF